MSESDIIKLLRQYYKKGKDSPYVKKPLAWALYQVWKAIDMKSGVIELITDESL